MSGVRMPIFFCQNRGELGLALRRDQQAAAQPRQRADADVLGDRPLRENAVRLPVAGDERHRRGHLDAGPGARSAAPKIASSRSVWPCPASPARPMISPARATSSLPSVLPRGTGADPQRTRRRPAGRRSRRRSLSRASAPPIAATSLSRSKAWRASAATTLPSRITTMRSALLQHLAEQMRDQDAAAAAGDEAAHEGQQLAGRVRIERGGRLVEDDQSSGSCGHREGARHLDHLAPADGQVADDVGGRDAVARKDLVELGGDQLSRLAPPAEAAQRRHD